MRDKHLRLHTKNVGASQQAKTAQALLHPGASSDDKGLSGAPLSPAQLMRLHQTVGNQAVNQLLTGRAEQPIQRKIGFNDTKVVLDKKYGKDSVALKEQLQEQYDTQWKRGWITYLQEKIGEDQLYPYADLQELVQDITTRFPAAPSNAPVIVERLTKAFRELDRGVVGFIWAVCQSDIKLSDGSLFSKRDLIDALRTKEGRELIDGQWRDSAGSKKMDQTIQGQHEWILTSDIVYVIEHCKSVEEVALWFSAAEMLRSPTKNVIFDFELGAKDAKNIKSGKVDNFAELGVLSAHAGGIYAERSDDDEKKKDESKHNVQVASYSAAFHNELHSLLTQYLNNQKNDLEGFLQALIAFQKSKVWSGEVDSLGQQEAEALSTGFYTGAHKRSPEVAPNMQAFMLQQQERYKQDLQIMANRTHAILSEVKRLKEQAGGMKLAVDTSKLRELDDDIRTLVEAKFNELDEQMNKLWSEMRESYLQNHSPQELENDFLKLRAVWESRYNAYIQEKVTLLDQAHRESMSKQTT